MKIIALEGEDRAPEHQAAAAPATQIALIAAGGPLRPGQRPQQRRLTVPPGGQPGQEYFRGGPARPRARRGPDRR
jgi:hypothetical protein